MATNNEKIVLYRTWIGEIPVISLFLISVAIAIYLSYLIPFSIQETRLPVYGVGTIMFKIPLFGLLPLVMSGYLVHRLRNFRYVIGPDFVSETEGLTSLRKIDRRLEYQFIRGVEIERSFFGRIVNVGDLKIGGVISSEIELNFRGIHNPSYWRDVIINRMKALDSTSSHASPNTGRQRDE